MTFRSLAFSARARCDRPRLIVGSALIDQPGRFEVGPEEKRGFTGLVTGLATGEVADEVTGWIMIAAGPDSIKTAMCVVRVGLSRPIPVHFSLTH